MIKILLMAVVLGMGALTLPAADASQTPVALELKSKSSTDAEAKLEISVKKAVPKKVTAEEAMTAAKEGIFAVNNLWILLGAALVFMMHLGFALVETGLTRAKNCVNILCKNTVTPAIGILTFALVGFGLMYPGSGNWLLGHVLGFAGFGLNCPPGAAGLIDYNGGNYTYWTDFIFQGMFAATGATIVSGAVAGRIKLNAYILFTVVFAALVYPIVGSWGWGGGWLADLNFHDLAGSTFVHAVGGAGALAGVIILGPRTGKFVNGVSKPIIAHNMPLAAAGVFLLWFGWFGFNGASAFSADPYLVSYIFVTTTLAAASGVVTSMIASWSIQKKPDVSMMLNGALAGLVAITAGADCVSITASIVIGAIAGVLVVLSVMMFDRLFLDDPVGALSVHFVCGIFGTLAVGIFTDASYGYTFGVQLLGISVVAVTSFIAASAIFLTMKYTIGIRVSEEEELRGLDVGEHGMEAYGGFQIFTNQ